MVKILHTSDWHCGKKTYEKKRNDELIRAIQEMKEFIRDEKIDVFINSGDIFESDKPSAEDQEIIWESLAEITQMVKLTILIAGNHDPVNFLESLKPLLEIANIKMYSDIQKAIEDISKGYIPKLEVSFFPIPYIPKSYGEGDKNKYKDKIMRVFSFLGQKAVENYPAVLIGHMMIRIAKLSGSERTADVIDDYSVDPTIIKNFRYVFLGHVHKNQKIPSSECEIFYAGSPIRIDFSEKNEKKYFRFVVMEKEKIIKSENIEIKGIKELKEIDCIGKTIPEIREILKNENPNEKIIKVIVSEKAEELRELEKEGFIFQIIRKDINIKGEEIKEAFASNDPLKAYEKYFMEKYKNEEKWEEVKEKFAKILERIKEK